MKREVTCFSLIAIFVTVIVILMVILTTCNSFSGDHPLGNHFSLLEGDRKEDRAIVYCSNYERGICYGGTYVVPIYERHMNKEGNYAEYVEDAESNCCWIVAKTYQIFEKKYYYWIIDKRFSLENVDCNTHDCDAIIQQHVMGPFSLSEFNIMLVKYEIDIDFE